MSINETRREAIINKLKELEEFLEPEGAHFVLHLFTSKDVTKELSTELESDMLELLKALKAERNDNGSKKHLYN